MMHKHHIIPKHMGGTDDPSNLIECTIEEHSNYHKELWEKHGIEWDRIAWLSLSGQINVTEAKRMAQLKGASIGGKISSEIRRIKGNTIGDWNRKTGHVLTIATKESCQKGGRVQGRRNVESGKMREIQSLGGKIGGKIAMAKLNLSKWKCIECGMISTPGGIGNHQKGSKHEGKELVCPQ